MSYTLILKKFLYFPKRKLFLNFRKKIPYVSERGTFLYFRRNFQSPKIQHLLYFSKKSYE